MDRNIYSDELLLAKIADKLEFLADKTNVPLIEFNASLQNAAVELVIADLNRMGNEGVSALSFAGNSESYVEELPVSVQIAIRKNQRMRTL